MSGPAIGGGNLERSTCRQRDTGARTDEYIDLFRALWSSDRPEFHGEFVELNDVLFKPRPVQKNASRSGLAVCPMPLSRRAVRKGDGWHVPRFSVAGNGTPDGPASRDR